MFVCKYIYIKKDIKCHNFYLVIFLTICPKLILTLTEWKIADSTKILSATFNIIISYIFPENFIEIHHVSQKKLIFTSSILTIFAIFLDCFTFTCTNKKTDNIGI